MAYAGNLTAMITRPTIIMKYESLEDVLYQEELSLVTEDGSAIIANMRQTPPESVYNKLMDKTEKMDTINREDWPSGCFSPETYISREHASLCDIHSMNAHLSDDYSANGMCNWYTTKSKFFHVPIMMAFQVFSEQTKSRFINLTLNEKLWAMLQKGSPYLDDANKLIDLAQQLGIIDLAIQKHIPNATKCSTWRAVQVSHLQRAEMKTFME